MTKLKRASNRRYFAKHWQLYSMLLVMFVSLLIFNYWPMTGLQLAFKDWVIPIGNQAMRLKKQPTQRRQPIVLQRMHR